MLDGTRLWQVWPYPLLTYCPRNADTVRQRCHQENLWKSMKISNACLEAQLVQLHARRLIRESIVGSFLAAPLHSQTSQLQHLPRSINTFNIFQWIVKADEVCCLWPWATCLPLQAVQATCTRKAVPSPIPELEESSRKLRPASAGL